MNYTKRYSNNAEYIAIATCLTDQEAITIYLFGLLEREKEAKGIYQYDVKHLKIGFLYLNISLVNWLPLCF